MTDTGPAALIMNSNILEKQNVYPAVDIPPKFLYIIRIVEQNILKSRNGGSMGRNAVVTVEKIVRAARELLIRYGIAKTTIEDIAKTLGIGKSSLYYHFQDKEKIIQAVLDEDISRVKVETTKALDQAKTPQEKLKIYINIRMDFFRNYLSVFHTLKSEYYQQYALIQKIREDYDRYEESLIRDIMTEGVATDVFRIDDIELTSQTVFATIKSLEYDWGNQTDPGVLEKNIDALLGILLHGIMKGIRR
jgi:AcrR family transcriptional regulator